MSVFTKGVDSPAAPMNAPVQDNYAPSAELSAVLQVNQQNVVLESELTRFGRKLQELREEMLKGTEPLKPTHSKMSAARRALQDAMVEMKKMRALLSGQWKD